MYRQISKQARSSINSRFLVSLVGWYLVVGLSFISKALLVKFVEDHCLNTECHRCSRVGEAAQLQLPSHHLRCLAEAPQPGARHAVWQKGKERNRPQTERGGPVYRQISKQVNYVDTQSSIPVPLNQLIAQAGDNWRGHRPRSYRTGCLTGKECRCVVYTARL